MEIKDALKECYTSLINHENTNIIEDTSPVLGSIKEVAEQEVRAALKGMKQGKATFGLLKVLGDPVLE